MVIIEYKIHDWARKEADWISFSNRTYGVFS